MPGAGRRRRHAPLDEFALIERIRARFGSAPATVVAGIGDDAAVVRASPHEPWVVTTDLLADGVHFSLTTTSLDDLGYKAGAANLSDLAAMGATPRYVLVDVAIPDGLSAPALMRFYHGLSSVCRPYGVALIGGDTSRSQHGLFLAITAIGHATGGRSVLRKGARKGDLLFVTGTLGDSLAGLTLLQRAALRTNSKARLTRTVREYLLRRHRRPSPRVAFGQALARHRLATAMIDLSDGLSGDLPHLCRQSHVGALIEGDRVPLSPAINAFAKATAQSPLALALQGGEDYELLFSAAPTHRTTVRSLGTRHHIKVTEIGRIMPRGFGIRLHTRSGGTHPLPVTSYRHFEPSMRVR